MENIESFEHFAISTYFPFILNNRIIGDTHGGNAAINALNESTTMTATITAFNNISSMYSSENNGITDTNKANRNKTLLNDNVFTKIVEVFTGSNLTSIDMHVSDESSIPEIYYNKFNSLSSYVYMGVINQIKEICTGNTASASTFCGTFIKGDVTDIVNICNSIKSSLLLTIYEDHTESFNQYIEKVYNKFQENTFQTDLTNNEAKLLFMCMTPVFYIIYYSYYVPNKSIRSGFNNKNREFTVKRNAILNIYKVVIYTLYSIYKVSVMIQPYSKTTVKLQQIYDSFLNKVLLPESVVYAVEFEKDKVSYKDKLKAYKDIGVHIEQNKREIEFLRSETTNIYAVKDSYNKKRIRNKTLFWVSLSLTLLYVILGIILYFMNMKKVNYYYIILSFFIMLFCLFYFMINLIISRI